MNNQGINIGLCFAIAIGLKLIIGSIIYYVITKPCRKRGTCDGCTKCDGTLEYDPWG